MAKSLAWGKQRKDSGNGEIDCAEVARVAYELYVQRGCTDGHDFDDWLTAEKIIRQRAQKR